MSTTETLRDVADELARDAPENLRVVSLDDERVVVWQTGYHDCADCGPTGVLFDSLDTLPGWNSRGDAYRQINGSHSHLYSVHVDEVDNVDDLRAVYREAEAEALATLARDAEKYAAFITAAKAAGMDIVEDGEFGQRVVWLTCLRCDDSVGHWDSEQPIVPADEVDPQRYLRDHARECTAQTA